MTRKTLDARIELLVELLDRSYNKLAWQGPMLRGSLRGITAEKALWRPAPNGHNIWEIVLHVAYWKYIIRRRLTRDSEATFPRKGSNWIKLPPVPDKKAWKADLALLQDEHELLREALVNLPPSKLNYVPPKSKLPNIRCIFGIVSHDVYHTGQIQLLKRLQRR